ncbi:MAG: virulence-related protein [Eubacteriales bacterium]|nr:virulence-related protein [Eubacteriales bacterium]
MEKKEILKSLEAHFGVKPKYLGVPSLSYQIQTAVGIYTIDKVGKITDSEGNEVELETLVGSGIEQEKMETPATVGISYEVSVPMANHTGNSLRNLVNIIYSKQALIKKSLGLDADIIEDNFCNAINNANTATVADFKAAIEGKENGSTGIAFDFEGKTVTLKFLNDDASPEMVQAYAQFIALLNKISKELKYASARTTDTDNDKFTFRSFLIRLGMIGDDYKMTRKVLLKNLDGNSAFRNGRVSDDN